MRRILVFAGSTSQQSINKKLARFTTTLLNQASVTLLDLNNFEMPLYGIDREKHEGVPDQAHQFKAEIRKADGIIMSLAEHNGSYAAAYKNIYDWVSRIKGNMWEDKPILLMAASPGGRGGKSVLQAASNRLPFQGGKVVATFSLPGFRDNFDEERGIINAELLEKLKEQVAVFEKSL
jgi:NAD(P)H-dependent FMN reductase